MRKAHQVLDVSVDILLHAWCSSCYPATERAELHGVRLMSRTVAALIKLLKNKMSHAFVQPENKPHGWKLTLQGSDRGLSTSYPPNTTLVRKIKTQQKHPVWVKPGLVLSQWFPGRQFNLEPSAPSKWPQCSDRLGLWCSSRTPSHQILATTEFFWISWMCHLLLTAASLTNLSPTALCSGLPLSVKCTQVPSGNPFV